MADVTLNTPLPASNAATVRGTAGAFSSGVTAGRAVYQDADTLEIGHADRGDQDRARCIGIALHSAADGQPITYLERGRLTVGNTLVVGEVYVLGALSGRIAPVADLSASDWVTIVGIAITANILLVDPLVGEIQQ